MDSDRKHVSDRRNEFKFYGLTSEELRRRREETTVELRRSKVQDSLNKRRTIPASTSSPTHSEASNSQITSLEERKEEVYSFQMILVHK